MRRSRKVLPFIVKMPKPYVFDIDKINKELKENEKVRQGIEDKNQLSIESLSNYSSFKDGTYSWFPISVFNKDHKEEFETFNNLKDPELDERRYTKMVDWVKGTYIEEVLNTFKGKVTRVHVRKMEPDAWLNYHMDYDTKYSIRFHVPLTTNPNCYFMFKRTENGEEDRIHLPADGSCYFFNQGAYHGAFNKGLTDRNHLTIAVDGQEDISWIDTV